MTTLSCKVTSVEAITDTVYRVRLVPDAAFTFRAGQYLMVVMDERDKRPFSMASTPDEKGFIELHWRFRAQSVCDGGHGSNSERPGNRRRYSAWRRGYVTMKSVR